MKIRRQRHQEAQIFYSAVYIKVDLSKADILAGEMLASLTAGFQAGRSNGVGCWTADHKIARQSRVAYRRLDYEDRVTGRSLGDTG